ncbi:cytochrome P450 [Desarmillaria tabescens]|uniref:Cytochrome P450 n=1 Tax=Armillaria tabescens TaxID=1929756 RepID=A0AA39J8M0_ARMTA|nr:cytochrome P450 [Desarmillaria tabescens]KAK0438171.1 cytochrome P450 [Desarmillaria tabescens]
MLSLSHYLVVLLSLLIFLTVFPLRRRRRLVARLRGPPRPSLLLGHEWQLRNQVEKPGDLEMQWLRQYGGAYRIGGCFGQDVLILSDPKALQYIFHTSGYRFPKTADSDLAARSLFGQGMVTVAGKIHQCQRKVLNPAFSAAQLHRYLILFQTRRPPLLTDRLKSDIKINGNDEKVVDVLEWIKRIALDIIGITSFRYHFNALDDGEQQAELKDTLHNLIIESQTSPSSIELLYPALWRILPEFASDMLEGIPLRVTRRFHRFRESSQRVARGIFQKQLKVAAQDEEKDIVNLLALSYLNQDAKKRMSDDEIYSQLATFIFAGHDTTSNTTSWLLYELSRHPDVQRRIHHEISEMRERDPSSSDYDSMPILNAAIKETLRFHPFIATLNRISSREDVLPLSEPVTASDGSIISEIPIPKGQVVVASIYIYNRLPSVWGEDADKWNPDRFLQPQRHNQTPLGVYANLAALRKCDSVLIQDGYGYSVLEMQVIVTELLSSFKFSLPEEGFEVMHAFGAQAISPVVKGKTKEGEQVPLRVTVCKL